MAQLKDTVVSGSLRATDTLYATTGQFKIINVATSSSNATYSAGTAGQVLRSGGATSAAYWDNVNNHTHAYLANTNTGAADRPIYITGNAPAQTTYRMAATNVSATSAIAITENLNTGIWYVSGTSSTDLYSQSDGAAYVNKYSDSWIHEIYGDYRTGQIAVRGKNNGTWQAWRKILDSSNYTNYTVTKTGGGASGDSWAISITGTANKATNDVDGNAIKTTYAKLASPEFTGVPLAPTAAANTNSKQIATTAFVMNAFAANDAMIYKGTLDGAATSQNSGAGGLTPAADRGHTYKVATAGYINGEPVEVGDMLICVTDSTAASTSSNFSTIKANWNIIQNNIDGVVFRGATAFTSGNVVIADGTSGKVKTSSYTIGKSVPSNAVFTDTNYYHTTGSWNGLTYTATANGGAGALAFTIPTGTSSTQVAIGNHTHSYAGSSSVGGAATTATTTEDTTNTLYPIGVTSAATTTLKRDTSITFAGGTITATSFSGSGAGLTALNASNVTTGTLSVDRLPASNVTANTYGNTSQQSPSHSGTFNIPYFTVDAKGRVTSAGTTTVKLPSDSNTDTLVKQTSQTAASELKLLSTVSASPSSGSAAEAGYDTNVTINPSTHTITASSYKVTANALITYNSATGCLEITV